MVKKPVFKIKKNGKDITDEVARSLISLRFSDEAGTKADQLELRLGGEHAHWNYGEDIVFSLGYEGETLWEFGTFQVLSSSATKTGLNIRATGVDFFSSFRQPKSRGWEGKSLGGIVQTIAEENKLDFKSDFDDFQLPHIAQDKQSDMEFLQSQAEKYDAMYNVKGKTLLFMRRGRDGKKNEKLPTFKVDADKARSWEVSRNARNEWSSCRAVGTDMKGGKKIEYLAGSGEPMFLLEYSFQDAVEAKEMAHAKLQALQRKSREGSVEMDGEQIYAWGYLDLSGTRDDDRDNYTIKSVEHSFSFSSGWSMRISFEA